MTHDDRLNELKAWFWQCSLNLQSSAINSVPQIAHPCDADAFANDAIRKVEEFCKASVDGEVLVEAEQLLPRTWRSQPDYEAVLQDVAAALAVRKGCVDIAREELDDLQRTFDLRWTADMRAVARWREGHPERELVLPDHVDLVIWLSEAVEAAYRMASEAETVIDLWGGDSSVVHLHTAMTAFLDALKK